eukprot:Trichotokara_eunicae@DN4229_c0_g1_i1.p1
MSQFPRFLEKARHWMDPQEDSSVLIDGSSSRKKKNERLSLFNNDERVRLAFITTGVGSGGLNIQAASTLVICEPSYDHAKFTQSIGRIARMGQKAETVYVYELISKETVEQEVKQSQTNRHQSIKAILGQGWSALESFSISSAERTVDTN